ncbi:MAG: RDD family protein, partial [Acidobacteriota bacterium]|nr:RDD family protein [Acidobacteriota bacterium]
LLVVGFLYHTISTALTGRTLGMKPFSLRVVDARTGLIPTGKQSAGRSLVYILSLASAGIALLYTFFDSERHTAHDRFTRTAVIRM